MTQNGDFFLVWSVGSHSLNMSLIHLKQLQKKL